MRIALAQLKCSVDRNHNLVRAVEAIATAAQRGAQLVAFPELAVDRFFPQHKK
ncbi:MAG: nitrilase-related carbon-nitrogen hydrolase, partial [Gemmatimonadales bacterium]